MKIASFAAAAALALCASAAHAQTPDAPLQEGETDLGVVEVTGGGRTERQVIDDFVADVTSLQERNGQVARFDERICPGVINLPPAQAQVINDRIAAAVLSIGQQVGRPGCEANVIVIFTEDSDRLAQGMMQRFGRIFRWAVADQYRGPDLLEEFGREGRTVRWWHLTERDTLGHDGGSRIRAAFETDIYRAILIVDTQRAGQVSLGAIGDYLAMAALLRMSPDADLQGLDTVLNLFDPQARPGGIVPTEMTDWDHAYLEAVYEARGDTRSQFIAADDISQRMQRRVNQRRDGRSIR